MNSKLNSKQYDRPYELYTTRSFQVLSIKISNHNIDYTHYSKPIQETIFVKLWRFSLWWLVWKKLSHFARYSLYF